jgi:hypothetical protein
MILQQFMSNDERKSLLQLMPEYEGKAKFLVQLFVAVRVQLDRLNGKYSNELN